MQGPTLDTFFSGDSAVAARCLPLLSGGGGAQTATHGAVTDTGTFHAVPGRDRLHVERRGILSEVIFGPIDDDRCACRATAGEGSRGVTCPRCGVLCDRASLRGERWGHIDVVHVVHPAAYMHLQEALGQLSQELRHVTHGKMGLRAAGGRGTPGEKDPSVTWEVVSADDLDDGDLVGPQGLAAALRRVDPEHPLLPLCMITRVPVPPPGDRPFAPSEGPTQVDPWVGPVNEAWITLVERAARERRLVELEAPPVILRSESIAVQQAFEAVFRQTQRFTTRLVPPLVRAPGGLDEAEALTMAFLGPERLIVQRRDRVVVLDLDGEERLSLPPAGTKLRGVARGRYAVFEGFFASTHPMLAGVESGFGPDFVSEDEEGGLRVPRFLGEISVIDADTGMYLERLPPDLPLRFVTNDQPEDLFLSAEDGAPLRRLRAGGDRPSALAYAAGLAHAWVGEEGDSTEIIDLERGIPHAYPCEPEDEDVPRWDLLAMDSPGQRAGDEEEGEDDEQEEEEFSACAVTHRDGAWHLLWSSGILCDHRARHPVRLHPPPRAAAFDATGRTLAVLAGDTVVLIDAVRREVLRRWEIPSP